jgi:hypothetical protein
VIEVATVVQQIMPELSKAVSEKDKKMVLNERKWLIEFVGRLS